MMMQKQLLPPKPNPLFPQHMISHLTCSCLCHTMQEVSGRFDGTFSQSAAIELDSVSASAAVSKSVPAAAKNAENDNDQKEASVIAAAISKEHNFSPHFFFLHHIMQGEIRRLRQFIK
jgi:hypothetical protein